MVVEMNRRKRKRKSEWVKGCVIRGCVSVDGKLDRWIDVEYIEYL